MGAFLVDVSGRVAYIAASKSIDLSDDEVGVEVAGFETSVCEVPGYAGE